uniref:ABC transporter domain-containing protein n=1 Tax=Clytia hemisphaerica TaxID=252671 RepID=A0A7M5XMD2_9CNID
MAIIKSKAKDFNETLYDIQLQRFPYPDGWRDNFIIVIQSSLPLLLMLSLVYSALVITKNVVHEKERKLKESMKMMGLSNWLHWAAWFIKCFVFLLIPMFICSLMLCLSFSSNGRKMLNHSDGYLIFIFLMLYATSGIMFCFFVSTLFYRANIAAAGAGVLWFLTYIPYFFLYNYWFTMSVKSKILACLDFQVAMSFGSYLIGQFEGQGQGVQWSNINQGVTIDDKFTFGHVLMMQVVDIIFYGLLTWYIEGVFPGEYGIPKKFYFPFSKKYWCNVQDLDEERIALTDCDDLENNRKAGEDDSFEEYPEDRKIGIQIQNLRKTFKTEAGIKQAVDDLSLNLYEGEITALLGHNGAGKTTTISMLTGLFPPTSGNAVVNGYDIIYNMDKIRGSLGICPQHNVLFDTLTVEEHLIFFATLKGMKSKQKIEEEVNRMIESIGLSDKRNAESRNLSGGMKRKLSVGNALIGDSKVVILDEPTSGMDVGARRFTWDLLQRERRGRTILLTTHFMDEADVLGDRIAIMASGKVQCYGSSLFLKKRYGVGYHMVMVKTPTCDPSQVQNLIENYVPTAQLESNIGLELSFILPSEYSNKFEELFTEIESNREGLGIASYGASVTTLEEVFIKVGEEQDTQESRSHTALFRQLSGKDQDSTNGTALPTFDAASIPFYQPTYEKNTGWTLFFQRWKAMFYKKILHSKRHKWSLIAQLVVPTINVLLGLIVVRTFPNATASPPLAMDLGMFTKDQYIPYCSSTTSRICTNRTPFYNAFAKALHTESNHAAPNSVNDGFNVTQYVLTKERRDLARFNLQYPVGFEAQQVGNQKYRITGWFNNEALHTSAVTLNLLANILLANFTNNEFTIKSRNYPLPPTTSQSTTDTRMNPVGFQIGLNQNFGMAFVAASFIVFLVQERSSKAKHLQFVSGVDPISYWTSSYLWDMINFMLPCLSIIILFAVFQQEGYRGESLGYIMILFITYGWAVIPMMYIFSYLFQVASTAFVRMTILNILTGLATLLVVYILSIPSIGLVDVAHALKWAFLIFPNYNLGQAMIDLFNNYEFKHVFESEDPVAMCTQFLRHVPGAGQIPSQLIKQMCNESLLSYDSSKLLIYSSPKELRFSFLDIVGANNRFC